MKKIMALILSLTMILALLAGCGNGNKAGNTQTGGNNGGESEKATAAAGDTQDAENSGQADAAPKNEEHIDLTMLIVSPNCNETELNKIAEKCSEITEAKFNTTLHLISVTPADYANKMNMMLASGDTLDIFQGFNMFNQYVSQGYMKAIEDYEEYYKDALEIVGDRAQVAKRNGHTYGIPFMNLGGTGGDAFSFRKDIVDELGINLDEVKTWDDFADVLRQIKAAYPDMTPLMGGGNESALTFVGDMSTGKYTDTLGDSPLVNILNPANNDKVSATARNDGYKIACNYAWEWAKEGLIGYDEVSLPSELVKGGKSVIMHSSDGPVVEEEVQASTGYEVVTWVPSDEKYIIFTNNAWTWSITDYCEYPERALEVLNEFYINADLANLLEWGIEGEHYRIVDQEKGIVDFLEGEHMGNVKYYNYIKDNIPNCYLSYVGVNEKQDKWELYQAFKDEKTEVSPYLGFALDQMNIQNQVAACRNILDKYNVGLLSGQLDPSTEYPKMLDELEAAGIDDIVEEAQKQLDAWIAENK